MTWPVDLKCSREKNANEIEWRTNGHRNIVLQTKRKENIINEKSTTTTTNATDDDDDGIDIDDYAEN